MNARQKLNRAVVNGCALLAAALGYLTGSWLVFGLVLAAAVALAVYAGDIRPKRKR